MKKEPQQLPVFNPPDTHNQCDHCGQPFRRYSDVIHCGCGDLLHTWCKAQSVHEYHGELNPVV